MVRGEEMIRQCEICGRVKKHWYSKCTGCYVRLPAVCKFPGELDSWY